MAYEIRISPRSERETTINERIENASETGDTIYDFRGDNYVPKVISLSIDMLVYRMTNCRTFSAQQSEIAIKGLDKDYFTKGQELSTAQAEQHQILVKLAKRGTASVTPIIDVLAKDGQRETILITGTGVVVNGNRRLAAMRELYKPGGGETDERFSHVKCSVLPSDTTTDEIDDIEADLQARPQTKLDYDWIGDAQLVRRQVGKGRSTKQVADRLRRSKADIENVLKSLDEADLYLSEWVRKPGQYELLSGEGEQIFGDIPKKIASKDVALQNASRAIAWSLFENRDRVPGRVYSFNAAFGDLAPQVLEIFGEQIDIDDIEGMEESASDDDFAIDIDSESSAQDYTPLIESLRSEDSKDEAVSILIDACETAIERDKGQKSERAALMALSQANAKLAGIDVLTAGEETLPAMSKQVSAIRDVLSRIEKKISDRLNSNKAV